MESAAQVLKVAPMQEKVTAIAAQVGAGITVIGGLSLNEWLAASGIIFGGISLLWNIYTARKRTRILIAQAKAQGADMKGIE